MKRRIGTIRWLSKKLVFRNITIYMEGLRVMAKLQAGALMMKHQVDDLLEFNNIKL